MNIYLYIYIEGGATLSDLISRVGVAHRFMLHVYLSLIELDLYISKQKNYIVHIHLIQFAIS